MSQKRNEKRNEKRYQEEEEEEREENWEEEQEEEIWRGLSNKRYVSICIIEDMSVTFYWLFIYCLQMDEGWRMQKTTTENDREPEQEPSCEKRWVWNKVYILNWACIIIDLSNIYYFVVMTLIYSWFCFQIEKRRLGRELWRYKWRWSWWKQEGETWHGTKR